MSTSQLNASSDPEAVFSSRFRIAFGWSLALLLVFGVGGWSAFAELSGALIASGTVVVDRNVKKLQHRDGGIVAAINVKPGDRVKRGDVLIRLDETQTKAELDIVRSQLLEFSGRKARLEAERDGAAEVIFPEDSVGRGPQAALVRSGEVRLFEEARRSRDSHKDQLQTRIGQLQQEISGISGQRDAKRKELGLISKELGSLRSLQTKALIPMSRIYSMEREETKLTGELGSLIANIARAHGQIAEINIQLIGLDQTVRSEAQKELRAIEARLSELFVREVASVDRLSRMDLKAPQDGIVHELTVHTVGGIITPAEPVLLIVPDNEDLIVEARFAPSDRDQLKAGLSARLRFTAFNQRSTPEVTGDVIHVSADVTLDPRTGQHYYTGHLKIDGAARKRLGDVKVVPGMPVEVLVATTQRTAFTYFTKPFVDQFSRAFRED